MELSLRRYVWTALGVVLLVMSGASSVNSASFDYVLSMDVTNRVYSSDLLNSSSADFQMLHEQVSGALYSIYGCFTCDPRSFYQGVSDVTFSNKSGSVIVKATLVFSSTQINAVVIKDLFNKVVSGSNEINGLKIDPVFTRVTLQSTAAPSRTPRPATTSHPDHEHEESHNAAYVFRQGPIMLASVLVSVLMFRVIFLNSSFEP